jgi:hypothetical protein
VYADASPAGHLIKSHQTPSGHHGHPYPFFFWGGLFVSDTFLTYLVLRHPYLLSSLLLEAQLASSERLSRRHRCSRQALETFQPSAQNLADAVLFRMLDVADTRVVAASTTDPAAFGS